MSDDPLTASLPALRKPNEVLVMISKDKGMTAVARKLYTVLLWEAQQQMRSLGRVPEATHLFEMPLRRALLLAGSSTESRTLAQGYLREMRKMAMTWEAPGTTNGPEWRDMALLSQAAFEMRHGERLVQWAFPPDLIKALLDPKLWTLQDLPILARLESYGAIALYDVCSRYKNNPSGVTHRASPEWWVSALSSSPKKREWRKVKNESVLAAIAEINEKSDIEVALLEHRQGRAVTEVQFAVRKKRQDKGAPPGSDAAWAAVDAAHAGPVPQPPRVRQAAEGLGLQDAQLAPLVAQYSEDRLVRALLDTRARVQRTDLSPVRNPLMYLMSLLDPRAAEASPRVAESAPAERAPRETAIPAPAVVVDATEAARRERFDHAVAAIAHLPVPVRAGLLQMLSAQLKEKGLLTPSIAKRVREGDWTSPLLKAEMVKLYLAQQSEPAIEP